MQPTVTNVGMAGSIQVAVIDTIRWVLVMYFMGTGSRPEMIKIDWIDRAFKSGYQQSNR